MLLSIAERQRKAVFLAIEVIDMAQIPDEVSSETAQILMAQATASGLSIDEYLKKLLSGESVAAPVIAQSDSVEDFMRAMESLSKKDVQPLPRDFSREDIYFPED